jgi:hypothetical protein
MRIKALVSAIAITSALTLSGGAFAQTMINGVEVSEDDLPGLQERCDELNVAATTESLSGTDSSEGEMEDGMDTGESAGQADATIEDAPDVNEVENATSGIDLDTVDLQACIDAGLITM